MREEDPRYRFNEEWMIPIEPGNSVDVGWTEATGFRPVGVTWHWTVTERLDGCRRLLGGRDPLRRGQASSHYGVGRTFAEGVDRYVSIENRSWHAGLHQTLRWDGRPLKDPAHKGSRTTIGIETVNAGFARHDRPPGPDWIAADGPEGQKMLVQPWTEAQVDMMVAVGREIRARWPDIAPRDHHGHQDLCPLYKVDPAGFPFATVLRRIYDDPTIPDVWKPLALNPARRRALAALGFPAEPEVDGSDWGAHAIRALRHFQWSHSLAVNGVWTVWVSWKVHDLLREGGDDLADVVRKKKPPA